MKTNVLHRVLIAALVITTLQLSGQNKSTPESVGLKWGPTYRVNQLRVQGVVGTDSRRFYTLGTRVLLAKLDRVLVASYERGSGLQKWQSEIDGFRYQGRIARLTDVHVVRGEFYLFYQAYSAEERARTILLLKVDSTGQASPVVPLDKVASRAMAEASVDVVWSQDSNRFAVYSEPAQKVVNQEAEVQVVVYNRDLEEQWRTNFGMQRRNAFFTVTGKSLANSGDFYLVGYKNPDVREGERWQMGSSNRDYVLYRFQPNRTDAEEVDLGLENVFVVSGVGLQADGAGNVLAVSGFYSDRRYGTTTGAFYFVLDPKTLDPIKTSLEPFSEELKRGMSFGLRGRGRRPVQADFEFRDFLRRADGGSYVVAEVYYYTVQQVTNSRGQVIRTDYIYFYLDVVVLSISPQGDVEYMALVPKQQVTRNDNGRFSGLTWTLRDSDLILIYNDARRNESRWATNRPMRAMNNVSNGQLVAAELEVEGQLSYHVLQLNRKGRFRPMPRYSRGFTGTGGGAVLFSQQGSRVVFGEFDGRALSGATRSKSNESATPETEQP
jgi:hypothetical protein